MSTARQADKDVAIVTRNRYGALVLNAASVLFVDVDYPKIKPSGLWDALVLPFSQSRREWRKAAAREITTILALHDELACAGEGKELA